MISGFVMKVSAKTRLLAGVLTASFPFMNYSIQTDSIALAAPIALSNNTRSSPQSSTDEKVNRLIRGLKEAKTPDEKTAALNRIAATDMAPIVGNLIKRMIDRTGAIGPYILPAYNEQEILVSIGSPAIPQLVGLFRDKNTPPGYKKYLAATTLVKIKDEKVEGIFIDALADLDVRTIAIVSLGEIGSTKSLAALKKLQTELKRLKMKSEQDAYDLDECKCAIAQIKNSLIADFNKTSI